MEDITGGVIYGAVVTEYGSTGKRDLPKDLDQYAEGEKDLHYLHIPDGRSILYAGKGICTMTTGSLDMPLEQIAAALEKEGFKDEVNKLVEGIPEDLEAHMSGVGVFVLWGVKAF